MLQRQIGSKKKSTQQNDGHSCGVFTIMHASKLAVNIVNKSNSEDVYEIGMGSKDDITKTRNWINEIITINDLTEGNKKGQVKEPEMLFYSTGRDAGDNEKYSVVCQYHKYRKCMRGA